MTTTDRGPDAATFLALAVARAEADQPTLDGVDPASGSAPGPAMTTPDTQLTTQKVAAALIAGALREALDPGWTRSLYHPDAIARADALASTTAHLLSTLPAHRAAELAGLKIAPTSLTASQLPALSAHLTHDAILRHLQREGARVTAVAQDPHLVVGRGRSYIVIQHTASTLRIKAIPSATTPGLGTINARPYDIPVIGDADPDAWYSYLGLGITTRLYQAVGEQLPQLRWATAQTTDPTTAIRRKLHAEDPYRWHWEGCPWCTSHLPAGWADSDETAFTEHPHTAPAKFSWALTTDQLFPDTTRTPVTAATTSKTQPAPPPATPDRRPVWRSNNPVRPAGLAAALAVALVVTTIVAVATTAGTDRPVRSAATAGARTAANATSPTGTPPAGPLPAGTLASTPPGWGQPAWAYAIPGWTQTATTDDGLVVTRTPTGQIVTLDPATAAPRWWTDPGYGADWNGPHVTTIDGQPVVALTRGTSLAYWTLPATNAAVATTSAPAPITVVLPAGTTVNWIGTTPLITSPVGPGVLHEGAVQPVPIPAGTKALAADGQDVVAIAGATWTRTRADGTTTRHAFVPPPGAKGNPVRVETIQGRALFAVWSAPSAEGQPIALVNATTGKTLLQGQLDPGIDLTRARIVRPVTGLQLAIGPVIFDGTYGRVVMLPATQTPTAVMRGQAYLTTSGNTTVARALTAKSETSVETAVPAGTTTPFTIATTNTTPAKTWAIALKETNDGWQLIGLPPL